VFRKRFDNEISDERQELGDFFADRLRLAFDFATLGAYELTGPDGDAPEADAKLPAPAERSEQSACSGARRIAPRRHVSEASIPCSAPRDSDPSASCGRGGRRGGSVPTPTQPCICADR
jgi:hypothetical protein